MKEGRAGKRRPASAASVRAGSDAVHTVYKVFVASPGDVARERRIAKRIIEEVSRSFVASDVSLVPCGWEDVPGALGRPQAGINPLVDEATLLIGVLYCRYGSHTGIAESGTEEEFERIHTRWKDGDDADAMIYFRAPPKEMLDDPGPQLARVLDFREKLDRERKALYHAFTKPKEFEEKLRSHLSSWLLSRAMVTANRGGQKPAKRPRLPAAARSSRAFSHLEPAEQLDRLVRAELAEHEHVPMAGFQTQIRRPIELERVMVPLRARSTSAKDGLEDARGALLRDPEEPPDRVLLFDEAWRSARRDDARTIVLLGAPGSGKTTLLRHLLLRCARDPRGIGLERDTVPLFLPLRLVRSDGSLIDAVSHAYAGERFPQAAKLLIERLRAGRGLLLLDGLDEVRTAGERADVARWIDRQRMAFERVPVVVTSRFAGYVGGARLAPPVLELALERFREAEIRDFLQRWFVAVETAYHGENEGRPRGEATAVELADAILAEPELYGLASNPLMLQIVALVHRDRGRLPERRVELYDECVNVLLEHWERAKGTDLALGAKDARRVLQPVARWLHEKPERRFASSADLLPELQKGLNRIRRSAIGAESFLEQVRDRSGLFTGYGLDEYGFQHLAFQEFLAAAEIRRQGSFRQLAREYGESWWREVTRLLVGIDPPESESCFVPFMREVVRSPGFVRHPELTAACLRDAPEPRFEPFGEALEETVRLGPKTREWQYQLLQAVRELPHAEAIRGKEVLTELATRAAAPANQAKAAELLVWLGLVHAREPAVTVAAGLAKTRTNAKDGTDLVLVVGGAFRAGGRRDPDNPARERTLPDFYLGRYPVTNEQYGRFLAENTGASRPEYWDDERFNHPRQPVVGVTWHEVVAYSQWAGLRLPSEWEWEKGARGSDGRMYPWGDDPPDDTRANFNDRIGRTTPVGSYPNGASPCGAMDMAGSVWEWTATRYERELSNQGPRKRRQLQRGSPGYTLRGGSFVDPPVNLPAACRLFSHPEARYRIVGFRCAQDP